LAVLQQSNRRTPELEHSAGRRVAKNVAGANATLINVPNMIHLVIVFILELS